MKRIIFSEDGWIDYLYWQDADKKTLRKINALLKSIDKDGALFGEGKPEKLKYREGEYSRRIDRKNRLIYEVSTNQIVVKSCKGHYD